MRFVLLIIFSFLCSIPNLVGQCPQQLSFTTQAQIDAFPIQYPGCDSIISMTISGDDIIDLTPLTGIRDVRSGVAIDSNLLLPNLKGLDSLIHGGYAFSIENNPSLTSLEGLGSLEVIDEFLDIINNPRLKDLKGLENLAYVLSLHVYENDSLETIDGLEGLREDVLVDIAGNPMLQNLHGLQNLEWGHLLIEDNDALVNLDGLEKVHTLGLLVIAGNEILESIVGLKTLEEVWDGMDIFYNPNLTECAIYYFCELLFNPDHLVQVGEIFGNGLSCNTILEILGSCELSNNSYANGRVYLDLNCNEVFDAGDVPLQQYLLESVDNNKPIAATTQTGEYVKYLFDNHILNIRPRALPRFTSIPASYQIITDTAFQVFDSIDFALCPDTLFHDLKVSLSGYTQPRPGFNNSYQICIQNTGVYTTGANIVFDFSNAASADYVSILSAEGSGIISGTTVTWSIPNIPIFTRYCMDVEIILDASTPLGTILLPHVITTPIEAVTEIDLNNNEVTIAQAVVGSVDPNDKAVNPDRVEFTLDDVTLEYTIRFQNTGTASATFIDIIDTLEAKLDISTFEMIQSSHSYQLSFPDSNVIQWHFDKIFLPDSNSNEQASHGFVKFRINTFDVLYPNLEIKNKASIYFDFNAPVITNNATTLVLSPCMNDFYFLRQSQVDSFALLYPHCDSLLSLYISGDDIVDLSPLSHIKSVSENITIVDNILLRDLNGLENLQHGGSQLEIEYNPNLVSLMGLSSLRGVNGYFDITHNNRLKDLHGLELLSNLAGLEITANDSLQNLDGLEGLVDLDGFPWIYLYDNPMLNSLEGLQNVKNSGFLVIHNNDSLRTLNGLENLEYLGELVLAENDHLESITALEKLHTVNYGINIENNKYLTKCAIDFFCDSLFHPFLEYQIVFNGPSCSSLEEILASCTITSITEIVALENISISPNPSTGSFYLQFDTKEKISGHIEILNANGTVHTSEKFEALNRYAKRFDIRSYSPGVYFMRIITNEGIATKKLFLTVTPP